MVSGKRRVLFAALFCTLASQFGALAQAAPEPAFLPQSGPVVARIESVRERRWGLFDGGMAMFAAG